MEVGRIGAQRKCGERKRERAGNGYTQDVPMGQGASTCFALILLVL